MQFEGVLLALNVVLGTIGLITPPAASSIVNFLNSSPNSQFWLCVHSSQWEQESHQWKWAWARFQVSFALLVERPTVCACFGVTHAVRRTDAGLSEGSASALQFSLHLRTYQLACGHRKAKC